MGDLALTPDRRVLLIQDFVPSISVFDSTGRLDRMIGAAGEGPGEFRATPRRVGWLDGTIWASDRFATHFFSPDGTETRLVSFRIPIPDEGSILVPGTPLADGSFLPARLVTGESERSFASERVPLRRVSAAAEVIDTLAMVEQHLAPYTVLGSLGEGGGRVVLKHPLASWNGESWLPVAVDPAGATVVLIADIREDAGSAGFDLLRIAADGDTLLRRTIACEPRPLTDRDEAFFRDGFAALIAGDLGSPLGRRFLPEEAERRRVRARELIAFPEHHPPVRRIVAGTDGSIWLLRESSPGPADVWEVYGETGDLEGTIRVDLVESSPRLWNPRLEIRWASRSEVWGTTTGEFDVPSVHRYRVVRECDR